MLNLSTEWLKSTLIYEPGSRRLWWKSEWWNGSCESHRHKQTVWSWVWSTWGKTARRGRRRLIVRPRWWQRECKIWLWNYVMQRNRCVYMCKFHLCLTSWARYKFSIFSASFNMWFGTQTFRLHCDLFKAVMCTGWAFIALKGK